MILIVCYDLHNPGRDYPKIEKVLKSADAWAHPQGSVWFLDTLQGASWWVDQLKAAGDPSDEFFASQLARNWASFNMDRDVVTWLKDGGRRW